MVDRDSPVARTTARFNWYCVIACSKEVKREATAPTRGGREKHNRPTRGTLRIVDVAGYDAGVSQCD